MFGLKSRQRIKTLESRVAELEASAVLVAIDRNGRSNIFTFARNGETFQIDTMGLLSDDVQQWRTELLS